VPSTAAVPGSVRAVPLVHRGASLGRWLTVAWNSRRFLAAYAEQFVDELVSDCSHVYPGREFAVRAPPLPRPKSGGMARSTR
jgi:LysR family cyn operon transcriptional activator